jgi:hypothetical protein
VGPFVEGGFAICEPNCEFCECRLAYICPVSQPTVWRQAAAVASAAVAVERAGEWTDEAQRIVTTWEETVLGRLLLSRDAADLAGRIATALQAAYERGLTAPNV